MAHDQLSTPPFGGTYLASEARTAAVTGDAVGLPPGTVGIIVDIDATAEVDTAIVTFTIQGQDPASLVWYDLLVSAAITAIGHTTLTVHPGIPASANVVAQKAVPQKVRINAAVADADALTYSVGITAVP